MEMRSRSIALDKIYKRRDRYEIPDWQRDQVWSLEKQRGLIDSILRGWKLPKFYVLSTGNSPETFDVVDGQQRLTAIWEFLDGEFELDAARSKEFGGESYQNLPDALSDAFDDYEIEFDVISDTATDADVKEFFQRLQAGLPLSSSEKLNSIHSKLRDYSAKLAKHSFFAESTTVANRRHGYFDICSKVLTLEIEGVDSGLRFDEVSDVFKANGTFSASSAVGKRVKHALDLLHTIFPTKSDFLRQRSMVQSVVTLVCHLSKAGIAEADASILREYIEKFSTELQRQVELGPSATDQDYITFQRTVNSNVKSGAQQRHEILLRKLFARHPNLYSAMSNSKVLEDGVSADITRNSEAVRNLITTVNERFAASNGKDLFKPTNKTVDALTGLSRAIKSVENYQEWIDSLYFVFRESVGQRLNGDEWPASFSDVNDLRTALQHDVDHGKGATAKRKKLSSVFEKYSGASTPQALAPELFPITQSNILSALVGDLKLLSDRYV